MLGIFSVGILQAQLRKIPADVTDAFKTKYPDATNVEWKDNLSSFRASFIRKGDSYTASFNNKGEWLETEEKIEQDDLPKDVKKGFSKSRFADREVTEVVKIEKKEGETQYRLLTKKK